MFNTPFEGLFGFPQEPPPKVPHSSKQKRQPSDREVIAIQLNIKTGVVSIRRKKRFYTYHATPKSLARFTELSIDLCLLKNWHCSPVNDGWILLPPLGGA